MRLFTTVTQNENDQKVVIDLCKVVTVFAETLDYATRICFKDGSTLDVNESMEEIVETMRRANLYVDTVVIESSTDKEPAKEKTIEPIFTAEEGRRRSF